MKAASAAQSRNIDRRAIEEIGIPSPVLMENAGLAVVSAIRRRLGDLRGRRIAIFCGKGNNGGDGFVIARHLALAGAQLSLFLAARRDDLRGDALTQANIISRMGLPITELSNAADCATALNTADLAVDALLGTGIHGEVTGLLGEVIDQINASSTPVIAVDIPSGLNTDNGQACGRCIRAVETVTFAVLKRGLILYPGAAYAGEITLAPISMPPVAIEAEALDITFVDAVAAQKILPERTPWAHKGSAGYVLIIGGSAGMTGAATLSSLSALRIGAGLVRLATPASLNAILEVKATEVVTVPVAETDAHSFSPEGLREALAWADQSRCVAIGPGLGRNPETVHGFLEVLPTLRVPLVLDADALNALADHPEVFEKLQAPAVITPHPGEMSRLLGKSTAEIQADRLAIAREAASRFGVITVLKGARTVIADPNGALYLNSSGNPGMASAGMGDVLTGTITGLIAQGLSPLDGAVLGVYLHGAAGDLAAASRGGVGILAGDVQEQLPAARQYLCAEELPHAVRVYS